jgi:hypothetical protein
MPLHQEYQSSSFLINRIDTLKIKGVQSGTDYKPEKYRKWQHPFRFHSWMPFYADIQQIQSDPTAISPGLSIMSQNDLSTLITTVGYEYSGGKSYLHSRIRWQGWLPVLESGIDYGGPPDIIKPGSQVGDPSETKPGVVFTNTLSLPLNFTTGRFSQYINASISSSYNNRYIYNQETSTYDYGQTMVTGRLYFSNSDILAYRDIYPRWGQSFDYIFSSFPADKEIYGTISTFKTRFYFPGFLRNQSVKLGYQYEKQVLPPSNRILGNRADLPRGFNDFISLNYRLYTADYALPLFYPDLDLPGFLYIKRIRGGVFYDYAVGNGNYYPARITNKFHDYKEIFSSYGFELLADFHVLRIPFLISAGIQTAWKNTNEPPAVQALFRIDVYGLKVGKKRL